MTERTLPSDVRFPWPWWKRLFHYHKWRPVYHSYECVECGAMSYD